MLNLSPLSMRPSLPKAQNRKTMYQRSTKPRYHHSCVSDSFVHLVTVSCCCYVNNMWSDFPVAWETHSAIPSNVNTVHELLETIWNKVKPPLQNTTEMSFYHCNLSLINFFNIKKLMCHKSAFWPCREAFDYSTYHTSMQSMWFDLCSHLGWTNPCNSHFKFFWAYLM